MKQLYTGWYEQDREQMIVRSNYTVAVTVADNAPQYRDANGNYDVPGITAATAAQFPLLSTDAIRILVEAGIWICAGRATA